ncbi:MAG: hypothetical protein ACEPOW_03015 [Bacteroidales bacterium]
MEFKGIQEEYQKRYQESKTKFDHYSRLGKQFSLYRILVFIITVIGVYFGTRHGMDYVLAVFIPGLIVFLLLVKYHSSVHRKKKISQTLMQINEKELDVLDMKFTKYDGGSDLNEVDHPYTHDLDVFGKGSLFQYINRCVSFAGRKVLSDYLKFPEYSRKKIIDRQKAVKEIAPKIDWRQNFQLHGLMAEEKKEDLKRLKEWLHVESYFDRPIFWIFVYVIPAFMLASVLAVILNLWAVQALLIPIFISLSASGSFYKRINYIHFLLDQQTGLLKKYQSVFESIEKTEFEAPYLKQLQQQLKTADSSAVKECSKLYGIAKKFEFRNNIIVAILLNILFLWDIRQCVLMEKWRRRNKKYFEKWLDTLSEFDALNSLATLTYNRSDLHFPTVSDHQLCYQAKNAGHLLINPQKREDNPISFNSWKEFQIITGANMAGKSTYLRTVGSNLILAMAGAPVCAEELTFAPVQIFTSIKTVDSLLENESYFFAELKRLKEIIVRLEKGEQLFIILDEILKGTNSKDKQTGSMALVEQLIRLGASGIIATHDLVLGSLATRFPENVKNYCFEVEFQEDHLIFDYQLKKGISQNLNATFLMKQMGITL